MPAWSAILGTFFGCGLSRFAPGTVGSIAAAALAYAVPGRAYGWAVLLGIALTAIFGAAIARREAARTGFEDPPSFVLDEALGVWIALWRPSNPGIAIVLPALVLFRILDILKPGPIGTLERVPRGRGVMLDDAAAGLVAGSVVFGLEILVGR